MLRFIFKKRLPAGILLLLISLSPYILSDNYKTGTILTLCFASFCCGISLTCDYIATKISGVSIISLILSNSRSKLIYLGIGLLGGLILEGSVSYISAMWYYPYYSTPLYFTITVLLGGFAAYFLSIVTSYYAVKAILDKLTPGKKTVTKRFKYEPALYGSLFTIGIIGLSITITRILINTSFLRSFSFNISSHKDPYLEFPYLVITFFSLWFVFEFIQFKKGRSSLIKDTLHRYYNPLIAIVISSLILAIYMEVQNIPLRLWIYSNMPLKEIQFCGMPIWVYFGWPLHYIGFLSLYRALGDEPSSKIWAGDNIE